MARVKLTLSAEKEVVKEARKIAEEKNTSISALFARYIKGLSDSRSPEGNLGPVTNKASGLISLPGDESAQELLEEALRDKYEIKE